MSFPRLVVPLFVLWLSISVLAGCSKHDDAPPGVAVGAQVPDRIVKDLQRSGVLGRDEEILAYYDHTLTLDNSEVSIVTTERVVYAKRKKVTSIPLADVADVRMRTVPLNGDLLHIKSSAGKRLTIQIAPLNDGPLFAEILEEAWRAKKEGAAIRRSEK